MIAVKRLQSLFWVLLVAFGALGAYLVSLRVATERNELTRVETQVAWARADIRYLETEFSSRANMRQLEAWNADDFRYSALPAEHYLDNERELAHLDGVESNGPAYVARPVMVAMAETATSEPAAPAASPAVMQIRADAATIRAESAGDVKPAPAQADPRPVKAASLRLALSTPAPQKGAVARRSERMALLDARLLDDRTLGDIGRRAAAETGRSVR